MLLYSGQPKGTLVFSSFSLFKKGGMSGSQRYTLNLYLRSTMWSERYRNFSRFTNVFFWQFSQVFVVDILILQFYKETRDNMNQGYNARKVISELYASLVMQSLRGNVSTGQISKPDMESIFHIKYQWNIVIIEKFNAFNLLGY